MTIRGFEESDREAMCDLAVRVFEAVSIDAAMEREYGELNGTTWQDRKRGAVSDDLDRNPEGCFVAEAEGRIVGFITTAVDQQVSIGHIPNLGVDEGLQGRGIGKALVSRALDYFEAEGIRYTQIETTTTNERGMRFYPGMGYREVARKIHYFMALSDRKDR